MYTPFSVGYFDKSASTIFLASFFFNHFNKLVKKSILISDFQELFEKVRLEKIDALIINYQSLGFDSIPKIKLVKRSFPEISILVINFDHSEFELTHLLKAGVNAICPPNSSMENILLWAYEQKPSEIRRNYLVTNKILKRIKSNIISSLSELSMIEIQCIKEFCSGFKHDEIGKRHNLSKRRIDNLFHSIRQKTSCNCQVDFVRFGLMFDLIDWRLLVFETAEKIKGL
ncbi:MAG: response regulator transcription factor [Bacteroidetes bacterium]|nr:response regulator transcription factor [Bacteroidota bacterium]MBL0065195.1 response regulator transcription factor [Bacteroidota bacterium]MBL0138410.1 response regulator transcription factor [Bacteroidota bacterium]